MSARDIQYEVFGPDLWQADLVTEETPGAGRHAAGLSGPFRHRSHPARQPPVGPGGQHT